MRRLVAYDKNLAIAVLSQVACRGYSGDTVSYDDDRMHESKLRIPLKKNTQNQPILPLVAPSKGIEYNPCTHNKNT